MKKYLAFLVTGLLGAMLLAASSASATTTLFAGGEDSDFTMGGSAWPLPLLPATSQAVTPAKAIRAAPVGWPPGNYALSPTFTANSTIWVHAEF